jgi:UDP-glucose:tetrahydrobiopterin glucosyltransferase
MTTPRSPLNILLLSTPVGPLGSGLGGGVELTLTNFAKALTRKQHRVTIVAPAASESDFPLVKIAGALQTSTQTAGREAAIALPPNAVLANMWGYARQVQGEYDLLLNFAYDWLPFYLTPFLQRPVAHMVSMGSLTEAMDRVIAGVAEAFPQTVAFHSQAQAATFDFYRPGDRCPVLGNGLDLEHYQFNPNPAEHLGWVGRISPEKGLEDAVAAAQATQIPLKIWGVMQDPAYWVQIQQTYPTAPIHYAGFLETAALQQQLGTCRALIMTPKWVEAFGNVAIEALACGVPVITYQMGGPAEIVEDGKTGWQVEPNSVDGLVAAIARIPALDRRVCRQRAEAKYSLAAIGDRLEHWFSTVLQP